MLLKIHSTICLALSCWMWRTCLLPSSRIKKYSFAAANGSKNSSPFLFIPKQDLEFPSTNKEKIWFSPASGLPLQAWKRHWQMLQGRNIKQLHKPLIWNSSLCNSKPLILINYGWETPLLQFSKATNKTTSSVLDIRQAKHTTQKELAQKSGIKL